MVPGAGVEPARPQGRGILSPLCLPIPPSGRRRPLYPPGNGRRESACGTFPSRSGAGKESRTLDLYLGKVSLYQLSYSRMLSLAACPPDESPHRHDFRRRAGAARIIRRQTGTVNPQPCPVRPPSVRSNPPSCRSPGARDDTKQASTRGRRWSRPSLAHARKRVFRHNAVPGGKLAAVSSP